MCILGLFLVCILLDRVLIAASSCGGVALVFVLFVSILCTCSFFDRNRSIHEANVTFHWTQKFMFSPEPESLLELEMPPKVKRSGRHSQSPPPAASPEGKKAAGRKSIRPVDREPMKAWLRSKLDRQELSEQLWWKEGEDGRVFHVRWPHAARQGYKASEDAKLYKAWAIHSGIYQEGDEEDHKKWKSNFRCAIHSLPDVEELTTPGQKKGSGALRTYRFLEKPRDRKNKKRIYTKQESTSSSDSCESDLCGSPSPSAAAADPSILTPVWPEKAGGSVLMLKPEEGQTPSIVFQSPNLPNFPVLGLSNFQTVNRASQSGGTLTVMHRESVDGEIGGQARSPIISYRIQPCTPISEELLDSIEDMQDVTEDDIKEEVEDHDEVVPVRIQPLYSYQLLQQQPAARTRTPSGDSGHPDSPQSTDLSVLPPTSAGIFGGELVQFELQEGCLLQVSDTADEGIEVHFSDEHALMTILAPVAVEEVQTIDNEFNFTGLEESAMDTS